MKKIFLKKEYINIGNLILVNSDNPLKENVRETNLEIYDENYKEILLDYNANLELHKILEEINSQDQIVPVSGYRSLEEQKEIYNTSLIENGQTFTEQYVAYPNCSEHQTGLAIDLGLNQENIDFIRPEFPYNGICQVFRDKAIKYGFIERYQKEKERITKISNEEWHFRYVGYPHSEIMRKMRFCLEEYIEYLKKFKLGQDCLSYKEYEISYLKMDDNVKEINVNDDEIITISGNNVDGIIITKKKLLDIRVN